MEEATGIRLALAMAILRFLPNLVAAIFLNLVQAIFHNLVGATFPNLVVDMHPKLEGAIFPNLVLDTLLNLVVVFLLHNNMRAIRRCRCLASNGCTI